VGYLLGYVVIAWVLLPLYYRLELTSIYVYLQNRFGFASYKTGASFFLLSRTLGATARLYLVVNILQEVILSGFGIPFWATTLIILSMILLYTYEGGVKTIVWTDTLQTTCMLGGLIFCTLYIMNHLGLGLGQAITVLSSTENARSLPFTKVVFTDPSSKLFFVKQVLAGAFITITMTGMDQEMMQKNISVRTLRDSQKNVLTLGLILLGVILLFLFLGGLLHLYALQQGAHWQTIELNGKAVTQLIMKGKDITADRLFPALAIQYMPPAFGIIFIIALISALFPSADGAITALTSSFCIDILGIQRNKALEERSRKRIRQRVHLAFAVIFLICVLVFKWRNSPSMISEILKLAGYTYGPLLGLFAFGIFTKRKIKDGYSPVICLIAPTACYFLDRYQAVLFQGYQIGFELLIINGLITFIGLLLISSPREQSPA
jgi:Na+/proline symporter